MGKLDMVIDFNNIAYRSMFVCTYSPEYDVRDFDTDRECGILIRKIAMDMALVIRLFKPGRVFISCDSRHPWRKNMYDEYKANRVKDDKINWDMLHKHLTKFKDILADFGFCVIRVENAEADDIAAMCRKASFEAGNDLIMVSSDKDWHQLVCFDSGHFCACYSPIPSKVMNVKGKRILTAPMGFEKWLSESSVGNDILFMNYSPVKDNFKSAISSSDDIIVNEIDGNEVVIEKIMCGDDGDNVPSFYEYYKNGRKTRVTKKRTEKIFDGFEITDVKSLAGMCVSGKLLERLSAVLGTDIDDIDCSERLMRQRMLVELNPELFPTTVVEGFEDAYSEYGMDGKVSTVGVKMDDILSGSEYLTNQGKRKYKVTPLFEDVIDDIDELKRYINKGL